MRSEQTTRGKGAVLVVLVTLFSSLTGCGGQPEEAIEELPTERPSILFVTLDTTRADRLGFDSGLYETPALDRLAQRGVVFEHAYATVPMTLPSHASMFTGVYPAAHGIHENGRYLSGEQPLLAEELAARGYATAAFISGYPLSSEFGVARGFGHFDDNLGSGGVERDARTTTDRVVEFLDRSDAGPIFIWVHYFDPHEPYEPPQPFDEVYPDDPYQGEIAFMDRELGRLVEAFGQQVGDAEWRLAIIGDHGEGLGDHGEALHGKLLYQGVMRVPLLIAGSGMEPGRIARPVSSRQAFDTILGWADGEVAPGWMGESEGPVLAEALKPFLQYGWQPQVMGVAGRYKVIRSGETEIYDLVADPAEQHNLAGQIDVDRALAEAIRDYPVVPASAGAGRKELSDEAARKLASLGYFDSGSSRQVRDNAPNPKDMTHIFRDLDVGSAMFVENRFDEAIRIFDGVHQQDPQNFVVALRLAVAHSVVGEESDAQEYFERARQISPASIDLRHYHAMHYYRFEQYDRAIPLFESVLAEMPNRLPALERMGQMHSLLGNLGEARRYLERVVALKDEPVGELLQLGSVAMAMQDTVAAIDYYERALDLQGDEFQSFLDLGVLYLANRQLREAASALDRVSPDHPAYDLALFKRAQVSVLLQESDMQERIRRAEQEAGNMVRELILNEQLFRDLRRQ